MRVRRVTRIVTLAASMALLAACTGGGQKPAQGPQQAAQPGQQQAAAPAPQDAQKLLIYHWWTAGGEKEGVDALFKSYKEKNPNFQVVDNPVPGGAGVEIKAVMKSLMLAGNPPTTFQVHAGAELKNYVDNGLLDPVTDLWQSEGYEKAYPDAIKQMVKFGNDYYAVPVGVHRANLVWYNKALFEKAGVGEPKTLDEFLGALQKLKAAGITPVAVASRNKWEVAHLSEQIVLATGGPDFYVGYFSGQKPATDPTFVKALETLKTVAGYVNEDHATLTWDQAAGLVRQGRAAMTVMGDWVKGYFQANGWQYGKDYGVFPFPGTGDVFNIVIDSFALAKGAPGKDAGLAWLKLIGSVDGQNTFNPIKGSIPPRTDAPADKYDDVSKRNMDDLKRLRGVPSAVHGSAAPDAFMSDWNDIVSMFLYTKDVQGTAARLDAVARDHKLGG